MTKITPCLWFDGQAEEAAKFYTAILPNSRIDRISRSPADNPSTPAGAALTVDFTLDGGKFIALNGGPDFPLHRGSLVQHRLSGPGRGRPVLGYAHRRRR